MDANNRAIMVTPLQIIRSVHNAFRRDMLEIDSLTYGVAVKGGDLSPILNRLRLMGEFLGYHAHGEEEAVFPALDNVAPLVAKAYEMDHRELDTMVSGLEAIRAAPNALSAARATAALTAHLRIHLNKEDAHMYPILAARTSLDDQASIVGVMAKEVPPERAPNFVPWIFRLAGFDDREVIIRVWMDLMPKQVFASLRPLIRDAATADWAELTRRIPELA